MRKPQLLIEWEGVVKAGYTVKARSEKEAKRKLLQEFAKELMQTGARDFLVDVTPEKKVEN